MTSIIIFIFFLSLIIRLHFSFIIRRRRRRRQRIASEGRIASLVHDSVAQRTSVDRPVDRYMLRWHEMVFYVLMCR